LTLGQVCASGVKLALHKDWLVVISDKNSAQLTELNASMRRIDLLCAIGAPLAVSMFSAYASTAIALVRPSPDRLLNLTHVHYMPMSIF
jgi:iron-regulated transporter 1